MLINPKKNAIDWISNNSEYIASINNTIWRNPEVGLHEYKTSKLCIETLKKYGFTIKTNVSGMPTAFIATWGRGKPVIGVFGELDALAGMSQKAVPFPEAVKEGEPGHGCAHNVFITSAVAGGIAIKNALERANIRGTIKIYGCPAEETGIGKIFMARDGTFKGLDALFGCDPLNANGVWISPTNAMNSFKVEFFGKASHAGMVPEDGRSALDALEIMNIGINYLREHIPREASIHYVTEVGGAQPNIVPPYARGWYYVRAPTREMVDQLYNRILNVAEGADLISGTTHEIKFQTGCYQELKNIALAELIVKNMREIGAPNYTKEEYEFAEKIGKTISKEQKIATLSKSGLPDWAELGDVDISTKIHGIWGDPEKGTGGSTDVGDASWFAPEIRFRVASYIFGTTAHTWQVTALMGTSIADKAAIFASKVIAGTAIDLFTVPEELKKIRDEFESKTEGFVYESPMPPNLKPPLDQLEKYKGK